MYVLCVAKCVRVVCSQFMFTLGDVFVFRVPGCACVAKCVRVLCG